MKRLLRIFKQLNEHPLAGKHKFRAYFNFFFWQLKQSIVVHTERISFVNGTKLYARKGMASATANLYCGLQEFSDMAFLLHFLREGDRFADIGANIGSYSVLAAGCCKAKTICFEPVPATYSWLQKNIQLNNIGSLVQSMNMAVGSTSGSVEFTTGHDSMNHVVLKSEQAANEQIVSVSVRTFDSFLESFGQPVLVKIDVEGFETEVIRGMSQTLENWNLKAIIIELNGSGKSYGYNEQDIHEQLLKLHFQSYTYEPFNRQLTPVETFGHHNTIYIRDKEFVENRLATSVKVKVFGEIF